MPLARPDWHTACESGLIGNPVDMTKKLMKTKSEKNTSAESARRESVPLGPPSSYSAPQERPLFPLGVSGWPNASLACAPSPAAGVAAIAAGGVASGLDGAGDAVPAFDGLRPCLPDGLRDYPGAKGGEGVYHTIISQMPPHDTYIEPFVGSGAVLRFKRPAVCSIAIDADPMVIGYWRNVPLKPELWREGGLQVICGDGIRFLEDYHWRGDELVYCDPPYLMETRSCQRDYYRKEFSDADHVRLLAVLKKLPCPVLLSGYWSVLYDEALQGWRLLTFQTMTRSGRPATECLWMNFPAPIALHDYQYLGAGFRERERIKRKKARWQKMLARMPALERAAVIEAVEEMKANTYG